MMRTILLWIGLAWSVVLLAGCASPEELKARVDRQDAALDNMRGRWEVRAQREDQRQQDIHNSMFHSGAPGSNY